MGTHIAVREEDEGVARVGGRDQCYTHGWKLVCEGESERYSISNMMKEAWGIVVVRINELGHYG